MYDGDGDGGWSGGCSYGDGGGDNEDENDDNDDVNMYENYDFWCRLLKKNMNCVTFVLLHFSCFYFFLSLLYNKKLSFYAIFIAQNISVIND